MKNSIPFALETFPLHFTRIPKAIYDNVLSFDRPADSFPLIAPALEPFHRRRLQHSCRLLGLPAVPASLWRDLDDLRPELCQLQNAEEPVLQIYSLRYFANTADLHNSQQLQAPNATLVTTGENWALLQRSNSYFPETAVLPFAKASSKNSGLVGWAQIERVGIAAELRCYGSQWKAKSHMQIEQMQRLKDANPILQCSQNYQNCEDLLCFGYSPQKQQILLLEGMKTNVFLLRYDHSDDILRFYTPRPLRQSTLLCGTTRNWLYQNFWRFPADLRIQAHCCDLNLQDLLAADALMLCNAAMGLRLVQQLILPHESENSFALCQDQICNYQLEPRAYKLFCHLLAVYWSLTF